MRTKTQPMEQLTCPAFRSVTVNGVKTAVQYSLSFAVVFSLGLCKTSFYSAQFSVAIEYILDGCTLISGCFLGYVGDHPVSWVTEISAIGVQLPQDQGKQAGLAGAICSADTDLLTRMNLQAGLFKQQPRPASQGKIIELQHGEAV